MRDLQGQQFGRLTAVRPLGTNPKGKRIWEVACQCGVTKTITQSDLASGRVNSCGCLRREKTGAAFHKHGGCDLREYDIWRNMIRRCTYPGVAAFKRYGARGISVCPRWKDFRNFYADMGPCPEGLTLERINNDGNYEPGNCRWASRLEQSRNRSNTLTITYRNRSMAVSEVAERLGLNYWTLLDAMDRTFLENQHAS